MSDFSQVDLGLGSDQLVLPFFLQRSIPLVLASIANNTQFEQVESLIDIFRFFTISQLIILIVVVLRSQVKREQAWATAFLCLSVIGYLIVDWEAMGRTVFFYILLSFAFCVPYSFWLFSKTLFDDDFQFKRWWIGLLFAVVGIAYVIHLQINHLLFSLTDEENTVIQLLHYAIAFLFIIGAIVEAAKNRKDDLVVERFQFRNVFLALCAVTIVLTLLTELAFIDTAPPLILEVFQKVFIYGLGLLFALQILGMKAGFYKLKELKTPVTSKLELDQKMITALTRLMEEEKAYLIEGLSIRQLAEKMEVKEYKLRQTINQQLGFANFNTYLNSYRIQAACDILADPAKQDLTILEIAFQMGYNSLAPFNKSFKQITGTTPTNWRKQALSKNNTFNTK